jgi:PAS domain S-box-containing protein
MAKREKTSIIHKAASSQKTNSPYILIVEDEPTHAVIIRHAIQSADPNAVVKVVESLKEYRNAIANSLPEIVLIDYYLPDGNPFDVMTLLPENGLFPFVVMTNSGDEKLAVKAIKAGALDYIAKTSESFQLVPHTIEHALREWKILMERKQAEEALRINEEKFRNVFESANVGKSITLPSGEINVNQAFCDMLGYTREELRNKKWQDITPPDEVGKAQEILDSILIGKQDSARIYKRYLHKNGSYVWADLSVVLQRDISGKPLYFITTVIDITERKQRENELLREQNFIKSITETSPIGITRLDRNGKILFANMRAEQILGLSRSELSGQSYNAPAFNITDIRGDIFPDELLPFNLVKNNLKPVADIQHAISWPDGQMVIISINAAPLYNELGQFDGMVSSIEDITEKKKVEEALRESESSLKHQNELLSTLLENLKIGVFMVEAPTGKPLIANKMAMKLLGRGILSDANKNNLSEVYSACKQGSSEPYPAEEMPIIRSMYGESSHIDDMVVKRPDSTEVILEVFGSPIKDENGRTWAGLVSFQEITERKRVEEELKESEEKYQSLFNQSVEGVYLHDFEGRIIDVNNKACLQSGYTREEILQRNVFDCHPSRLSTNVIRAEILHQWNQWQEGQTFIVEAEHQRKDGTIYPVEVSTGIVRYGNRNFILAIVKDITERKRAEEELTESEEKFAKVFHDAPVWIAITDMTDSTYLDVNDQVLQASGFTREEVIGHTSIEIGWISADDRARLMQELHDHGRIVGLEMKFRAKDGRTLYGWVSGEIMILGGRSCLLTIAVDVTERKELEEASKHADEVLRALSIRQEAILFAVPDIIMEVDNNKVYTWANYAGTEFFGDDVIGKEANFYFEGEQDTYDVVQPLFNGDENIIYLESWQRRKDGEKRLLAWWCRVLKDSTGKISGALSSGRDITENKKSEDALRQMQKLEGLGTLAGGIAHDFNNILGIILAYNTNIKRVKNDTKKLDLATETIAKAVERGKILVQQVLTFARKTDVTFGPMNVNDVVMEIVTMIYETFPRIVTCSQNFDKAIPCINADHTQLYQALLNLCVNARDAMPKGGILSINTSMTSIASLRNHHPEAAASSYICIEISDTGEGMTEEVRKHIFEPFFTTKGIGKGTGLGLSVTFGVIQSHKGFIDVESELGRGTTFKLYLPVTQVAVTIEVKDEEALDEIPGGTETLLVVEDEEMLMASLQMVLIEKGYNVLTAGDGLAALKIYQEHNNDIALVLTDLGLPNMTGLEVCQRIRAINPNEHLILATGFLDPDVKLEFIEAGIRHFLFKPYDIREVLKVVREVLDKK